MISFHQWCPPCCLPLSPLWLKQWQVMQSDKASWSWNLPVISPDVGFDILCCNYNNSDTKKAGSLRLEIYTDYLQLKGWCVHLVWHHQVSSSGHMGLLGRGLHEEADLRATGKILWIGGTFTNVLRWQPRSQGSIIFTSRFTIASGLFPFPLMPATIPVC